MKKNLWIDNYINNSQDTSKSFLTANNTNISEIMNIRSLTVIVIFLFKFMESYLIYKVVVAMMKNIEFSTFLKILFILDLILYMLFWIIHANSKFVLLTFIIIIITLIICVLLLFRKNLKEVNLYNDKLTLIGVIISLSILLILIGIFERCLTENDNYFLFLIATCILFILSAFLIHKQPVIGLIFFIVSMGLSLLTQSIVMAFREEIEYRIASFLILLMGMILLKFVINPLTKESVETRGSIIKKVFLIINMLIVLITLYGNYLNQTKILDKNTQIQESLKIQTNIYQANILKKAEELQDKYMQYTNLVLDETYNYHQKIYLEQNEIYSLFSNSKEYLTSGQVEDNDLWNKINHIKLILLPNLELKCQEEINMINLQSILDNIDEGIPSDLIVSEIEDQVVMYGSEYFIDQSLLHNKLSQYYKNCIEKVFEIQNYIDLYSDPNGDLSKIYPILNAYLLYFRQIYTCYNSFSNHTIGFYHGENKYINKIGNLNFVHDVNTKNFKILFGYEELISREKDDSEIIFSNTVRYNKIYQSLLTRYIRCSRQVGEQNITLDFIGNNQLLFKELDNSKLTYNFTVADKNSINYVNYTLGNLESIYKYRANVGGNKILKSIDKNIGYNIFSIDGNIHKIYSDTLILNRINNEQFNQAELSLYSYSKLDLLTDIAYEFSLDQSSNYINQVSELHNNRYHALIELDNQSQNQEIDMLSILNKDRNRETYTLSTIRKSILDLLRE